MDHNFDFKSFMESKDINKLYEITSLILKSNPDDLRALEFHGRALSSRKSYEEAYSCFATLKNKNYKNLSLSNLQEMLKILEKLSNFENFYNINKQKLSKYKDNWAREFLLKYLNSFNDTLIEEMPNYQENSIKEDSDEHFYDKNYPPKLDFDKRYQKHLLLLNNSNKSSDNFILGSQKQVDNFHCSVIDGHTSISLLQSLEYPFAQACADHWIYLKSQNFYLPNYNEEKYWYRKSKYEQLPIFAQKFPNANWKMPTSVIQPNTLCDVFTGTNLVDKSTHNMLKYELDKLADETNDYFVQMYQNIIDPNLYAQLDSKTNLYKWVSTDFIIEEISTMSLDRITVLQLCVLSKKKSKLSKNIINKIRKFIIDEKRAN